jgi:drug/metabolite transporter (DMT)-like permease
VEKTEQDEAGARNAYAYLLTTMVFFGSAFASSEVVVESMPHQVAAVLRFGGGAVILVIVLLVSRARSRERAPTRRQLVRACGVGLIGVFAYNVFFFWGLSLAPSADGSIIVPVLSPVITTIIVLATRAEQATARRLGGLALALAGSVIFFVGSGGSGLDGKRLTGDLIYLLGAIAWAIYSITSKKVLRGVDPLYATTFGTAAGAMMLLAFAAPDLSQVHWGSVSTETWLNVVYLAVGPTAVAYLCYFRGLRAVSPSTATLVMFTVPLFGVTCSVLFLRESFSGLQLVGGVIMLAGALLAVIKARAARAVAAVTVTAELRPAAELEVQRR